MSNNSIELPPQLIESLQKLAQTQQLSLNQLAENILDEYLLVRMMEELEETYYPDPAEMTELSQSVAKSEAEEAAGVSISII